MHWRKSPQSIECPSFRSDSMSVTAVSTPNIALIKYWGNRNNDLRLPMADSLSITLNQPTVQIIVDRAERFTARTFEPDGTERTLTEKERARLEKHFTLTKTYLDVLGLAKAFPGSVSLEIRKKIRRAIGIASSAAIFSCLAKAYAGLVGENRSFTMQEKSVIGRLGSGSAARSLAGGFVALHAGTGNDIDSAAAEQIADENHWNLFDVIIIPSAEEKKVGSTEGHTLAHTSPLFSKRIDTIPRRQQECIDAILKKDFEKLQHVTEEDALDMHNVMQTQTPPLKYLSNETYRMMEEVEELRDTEHLEVLYTMDAGPTVHLICTEAALPKIRAYAKEQKGCTLFEAGVGNGSHLLD